MIYSYAHRVFSNRRDPRVLTWRDVAVRLLRGNTHRGHDPISWFRRENVRNGGRVFRGAGVGVSSADGIFEGGCGESGWRALPIGASIAR
ncbi:hypothetical protein [Candidatus Methylacidithermus pantelleriae]|uniref:Uncharacterized protein n=1 Tax=Candidatus Methylacidithermus pantelleriae TaxID=2744239 RepID=A0A8J2BLM2_9BACT|nr:hypothetical protein [Candidatus Methylacidithermus pantelleriae]CAF0696953.1 hypothetical protein MPNT_200008 [Candidatus Methylacidithermus pantelleriae]